TKTLDLSLSGGAYSVHALDVDEDATLRVITAGTFKINTTCRIGQTAGSAFSMLWPDPNTFIQGGTTFFMHDYGIARVTSTVAGTPLSSQYPSWSFNMLSNNFQWDYAFNGAQDIQIPSPFVPGGQYPSLTLSCGGCASTVNKDIMSSVTVRGFLRVTERVYTKVFSDISILFGGIDLGNLTTASTAILEPQPLVIINGSTFNPTITVRNGATLRVTMVGSTDSSCGTGGLACDVAQYTSFASGWNFNHPAATIEYFGNGKQLATPNLGAPYGSVLFNAGGNCYWNLTSSMTIPGHLRVLGNDTLRINGNQNITVGTSAGFYAETATGGVLFPSQNITLTAGIASTTQFRLNATTKVTANNLPAQYINFSWLIPTNAGTVDFDSPNPQTIHAIPTAGQYYFNIVMRGDRGSNKITFAPHVIGFNGNISNLTTTNGGFIVTGNTLEARSNFASSTQLFTNLFSFNNLVFRGKGTKM
ncbi:MAG: hypothetical protein NZ108_09515, partial [Bacteroidia bacterium]|nr:hypothetical protein [Bacteroidia bacterium]